MATAIGVYSAVPVVDEYGEPGSWDRTPEFVAYPVTVSLAGLGAYKKLPAGSRVSELKPLPTKTGELARGVKTPELTLNT